MSEIIFVDLRKPENLGYPYSGTFDAIKAAEARSGCRVWVISDSLISCQNFIPYESCSKLGDKLIKDTTPEIRKPWATTSLLRWLAIYEFILSRNDITWPVFPLDHDVLVFSNLQEAYKPLVHYDFCVPSIHTNAAWSVHTLDCLKSGVDTLFDLVTTWPILNDMVVWGKMAQSGKWKVGDILSDTINGAFDSGIHLSVGRYVMEPYSGLNWGPETKKITWKDGCPYFTQVSDGKLIQVHWIHCWGSYKFRTKELIEKAGL